MSEPRSLQSLTVHAGLRLIDPAELPLRRMRRGRGFVYLDGDERINDQATLERIRALAIPPAYKEVRIAADPRAHIQAVGRDDAGRIQYRYHPGWETVREARKVERLAALCAALPRIRRTLLRDLRRPDLCYRKALAAAVMLIDRTHIRIGCEDYVHSGHSRGAATLLKKSVRRRGDRLELSFRGKRRQVFSCALRAPALARAIGELLRLPGRRLFQYRDDRGKLRRVTASDINEYLERISGAPVTAKDFRTLAATAAAARLLAGLRPATSRTGRRRQVAAVMGDVAGLLGNTPAVARKSYVHRRVIEAFEADEISGLAARCRRLGDVSREEALVGALFSEKQGCRALRGTRPVAQGEPPGPLAVIDG